MQTIYISPSDFAFLYTESKWGFYQKYRQGIKRPPFSMPKIFNVIDALIKKNYENVDISTIDKNLPAGKITHSDSWIKCKPIRNPDYPDIEVSINGKIDSILTREDGAAVIDFKTCDVEPTLNKKYALQLNAYAYGILNPFKDGLALDNINQLGLIVFSPSLFSVNYNSTAALKGSFKWIELDFDPIGFENFIRDEVIPLLAGPEPKPEENEPYWNYLIQLGVEFVEEG
jgi:hypothetical protein